MKSTWVFYVIVTIICWGLYVPTVHHGQLGFGEQRGSFRAFMFVGLAYLVMAVATLLYLLVSKAEPLVFAARGVTLSTIAGVLGALGALGILFALQYGGKPWTVVPLVFAGAPIVATFGGLVWDRSKLPTDPRFYAGIVLAACGAAMVLRFKPH